jgi:5-methylcytosine-specific restriction endonuclease McrA
MAQTVLVDVTATYKGTPRGGAIEQSCPWPSCDRTIRLFRSQAHPWVGNGQRSKESRVSVFCPEHRALIKNTTGRARLNGFGRVLAHPDRVYATRGPNETLKAIVFLLADATCSACSAPLVYSEHTRSWFVDHVKPVYLGGLTTLSNLAPLCGKCHRAKTRHEIQEVRKLLPNTSRKFWQTHFQKDAEISLLRAEVARLRLLLGTTP